MTFRWKWMTAAIVFADLTIVATGATAQKRYDAGASDTEIKIGQTMPYSGPASAYATIGKVQAAYFRMLNESGGIRGRKITLLSYDDGYNPTKTVEQVRKLVEIAATGARRFTDPEHFPWTMGFNPNYQTEGRLYALHLGQLSGGKDRRVIPK